MGVIRTLSLWQGSVFATGLEVRLPSYFLIFGACDLIGFTKMWYILEPALSVLHFKNSASFAGFNNLQSVTKYVD